MTPLPLLLLTLQTAASGPPSCEAVASLLRGRACVVAGASGLAVAPDAARAQRLAELAAVGEEAWRANHGEAPARFVVFEAGTPPETARDRSAFVQAGFPVAVAWNSPAAWAAAQRRAIEGRVREQMTAFGMGEAQIAEAVGRIQADLDTRNTPEAAAEREATGVPHQLGHHWFVAALWPGERVGTDHAGGPAADWLDEMAALLAEPPASAAIKREQFRQSRTSGAEPPSLQALLAGPPAEGVVRTASGTAGPGGLPAGSRVITRGGPSPPGAAGPLPQDARVMAGPGGRPGPMPGFVPYNVTSRIFLDYLAARSAGPVAARAMLKDVAPEGDLDGWLATQGSGHGLPTSSQDMESDWRAWVAERYPTP